jgi:formamidopyrimidine-DNA glycosylase
MNLDTRPLFTAQTQIQVLLGERGGQCLESTHAGVTPLDHITTKGSGTGPFRLSLKEGLRIGRMPELPEVETIAAGVHERIQGERIKAVELGTKKEPFLTAAEEMAVGLRGKRILRVYRVGKHIVFDLAEGRSNSPAAQWVVHLGMTGRLLVATPDVPLPPHAHAVLLLSSGRELRFVDSRRFGRLSLLELENGTKPGQAPFRGPGHEPLTIGKEEFITLFRGRKLAIKAALLNQKLLHGVGNIYADESLFRAGIRPTKVAGKLNRNELVKLHAALQKVLKEAISLGGSSVSDYVDADGAKGFFQLEHRVYLRTGQPCRVCETPIRRTLVAGRGTHFCPKCQR